MKIIISFFIFISFISCTKAPSQNTNQLNIALTSAVPTIDPAISYDTVSAHVIYQVYESLYEYDYLVRPYQVQPLLAEDFPIVENNGLKYTIKIKKGIYYHRTGIFNQTKREVIAQDFINQFKRIALKETKSNGWWLFKNKIKGLDDFRVNAKSDLSDFFSRKVSGLYTKDEHTLVIELKEKYPQLIYALAMLFTSPVAEEVIKYYKNDLNQKAIGTGPYKLKEWKQNHYLILEKNKNYYKQLYPASGDSVAHEKNLLKDASKAMPFIDTVKFHIMKEAQTRWLNFLKGNIDIITLTKDHFPLALNKSGGLKKELLNQNIKLQIAPTLTFWWISLNMSDPIIGNNLNLRKAIAHAIDNKRYVKDFTNSIGLEANSIFPPGILGYSPTDKLPYSYDKKLAKKYLKDAGYPEGKGLPELRYDVRSASTVARQMAEFIRSELAEIGIKVQINTNSFSGFLNKARTGQLQIWQGGWAMDYPDPENVIQLLHSNNHPPGPNSAFFSDPKVDKLYQQLFTKTDRESVKEITSKVLEQVNQHLPWIMQYYSRNYILYHDKVKNLRQSDLIRNYIKYLRVKN